MLLAKFAPVMGGAGKGFTWYGNPGPGRARWVLCEGGHISHWHLHGYLCPNICVVWYVFTLAEVTDVRSEHNDERDRYSHHANQYFDSLVGQMLELVEYRNREEQHANEQKKCERRVHQVVYVSAASVVGAGA